MRFLLDMPVSPQLSGWLAGLGHDAVHASDLGMAKAADSAILDQAARDGRIVVTADLDYPRLLALSGADRPSVVLFRGGNHTDIQMRELLASVLTEVTDLAEVGMFVVVDGRRIRKRKLPI